MFSPIFVANTKIIYGYNFVAALKSVRRNSTDLQESGQSWLFLLLKELFSV